MWWSVGLGLPARCPSAVHSIPGRIGVPGAVALYDVTLLRGKLPAA